MIWQEIEISLSHPAAEALAVFLAETEAVGAAMDDPAARRRLRQRGGWEASGLTEADDADGEVRVRFYVAPERSAQELLAGSMNFLRKLAKAGVDTGSARATVRNVDEEDWAHAWKAFFKPVPVGERLWIQPTWETGEAPAERIRIWLDPGMAFGTGTHPTTRLCLEVLDRTIHGGETVMDIGCGSGILAIAALVLGAEAVYGVDIDPTAIRVAKENSRLNGVEERAEFFTGVCTDLTGSAQIIVANIIADVIIDILPCIRERLHAQGLFVASGIILDRLDDVTRAIAQSGLVLESVLTEGDWVALTVRKAVAA
jgi:ribosomal protein L11 methyltransferase